MNDVPPPILDVTCAAWRNGRAAAGERTTATLMR
jgi:hypothetical protein